jgi:hypothetical protein
MVSQLSVYLAQLNATQREHASKMDAVHAQMRKMRLPGELCHRVEKYYSYLWHTHGVSSSHQLRLQLQHDLNPALSSEISVFTHRAMVSAVPFFSELSSALIQDVVRRLHPEVYLAGDYIIHMGDPARAMYFLTTGRCSVLIELPRDADRVRTEAVPLRERGHGTPTDLQRVNVLNPGAYFGEMACVEARAASAHVCADSITNPTPIRNGRIKPQA